MKYLMTMEPLEPYTFGTDHSFRYAGEKPTGRESYFVMSATIPEQTTILGMLRYLLLKDSGLLKGDFSYTGDDKERMKELIGEKSFSFVASDQNFGIIDSISPLFIVNTNNEWLVRCPFCVKADGTFMKMSAEKYSTAFGEIHFPEANEYNAKEGYVYEDYYNLDTGRLYSSDNKKPLFTRKMYTGNNKNDEYGRLKAKIDHDEGFFRIEKVSLRKGYRFACIIELESRLNGESYICRMGRGKAAFRVDLDELDENARNIDEAVSGAGFDSSGRWYYCLSDVFLNEKVHYSDFAIVNTKETRNLETRLSEKGIRRLRKSEMLFTMIAQGSVFYLENPIPDNRELKKIGYNHIIEIGGKQ